MPTTLAFLTVAPSPQPTQTLLLSLARTASLIARHAPMVRLVLTVFSQVGSLTLEIHALLAIRSV